MAKQRTQKPLTQEIPCIFLPLRICNQAWITLKTMRPTLISPSSFLELGWGKNDKIVESKLEWSLNTQKMIFRGFTAIHPCLQWSTLYAQPFPPTQQCRKNLCSCSLVDQMKLTLQRVHKMARREDGFTGRAAAEIFEIDLLKIRSIWQKIRSRSGLQKVI